MLEHCDNVDEERVVKGRDNIEVTLPPNSEAIKRIKPLIQGQITEKFQLTTLHAAAAYLDPHQSLNIGDMEVSKELLGEAITMVKSTAVRNGPPPTPTVTVGDKRPTTTSARHACRPTRSKAITDISRRGINDYSSDDDEGKNSEDEEDSVPREGAVEIQQVVAELQAHAAYKLTKSEKKMIKVADQGSSGTGHLRWWK